MNAARFGRLLEEAGENRGRWAEAICDEITEPSTGLVTKDHLDMRFALAEQHAAERETRLMRALVLTQASGIFALAVLILLKL